MDAVIEGDPLDGALSLYFATRPGELADLEVAAAAAIEWARGIKAAAHAIDPSYEYRVTLISAKPGSSNWFARVEQSRLNQSIERLHTGWKKMPVLLRLGIGLAVVIPTTAKPTYEFWVGDESFSDTQVEQMKEICGVAAKDPDVQKHQRKLYKEVPKDTKITGLGTGVPTSQDWKPSQVIPANQFLEAEGFFEVVEDPASKRRTIYQTLDVILVTPRLENARKSWTFRQEGLSSFNAEMADPEFLAALDRDGGVHESLRTNIAMRIYLEIKQERFGKEWRVTRRGRRVLKVLSPAVD